MKHVVPIFIATLIFLTSCSEENEIPALVETMLSMHEGLEDKTTCASKIAYAAAYLTKNESSMKDERADFDSSCASGKKSGMRCQSLRMFAGGRIEVELRKCRAYDTGGQLPRIFERLHEVTGAYFDVSALEH